MKHEPLTREEVRSVIAGKSTASRVPVHIHFWVHASQFGDREPAVREILADYPEDFQPLYLGMPQRNRPADGSSTYSWLPYPDAQEGKVVACDADIAMPGWDNLDEILANFPDPESDELLKHAQPADGRFRLAQWFFCLFERHWSLRGMTNALMDYYTNPEEVHRLFRALTDFYLRVIERSAKEGNCDALWTSDDLGTQEGPFFSPDIFREFFKPYYKEMANKTHECGMTLWMHACGNVGPFIPDWIDAGLDVLHPIQSTGWHRAGILEGRNNQPFPKTYRAMGEWSLSQDGAVPAPLVAYLYHLSDFWTDHGGHSPDTRLGKRPGLT